MTADANIAKNRQSYNRYTRRGLVDNVGLRAELLVALLLLDSKLLNGHNLERSLPKKGSLLSFEPLFHNRYTAELR